MSTKKLILFLALDLAVLALLLLASAYYGMVHLLLLFLGLLLVILGALDYYNGIVSRMLAVLFKLPGSEKRSLLDLLPVLLSLLVVIYSSLLLFQHGPVNQVQRQVMQGGLFPTFCCWTLAGTGVVIAIAAAVTWWSERKR
ncbi:MAG TPA: hypothetical protein PKO38_06535 [Bacillota bacterium]|jgi:uncharacterized membrane protein|nr:hypothetical protein [Bacillota bacterium]HOB87326.1 hypothetical protein [Bacillota bacterium]HOP68564.1 hypothetical protein [Bacillota bacterium]HPT33355.1 hypothetical protein [Bacillota bacterium]HQD05304.1 hypothetical protein [Bacillota bacterium]